MSMIGGLIPTLGQGVVQLGQFSSLRSESRVLVRCQYNHTLIFDGLEKKTPADALT